MPCFISRPVENETNYVTAEKVNLPAKVPRISWDAAETSLSNSAAPLPAAQNFVKNRQTFPRYDFPAAGNTFRDNP